jgi:hypothetical protein
MTGKSSIAIAHSDRLAESRLWQAVIVSTIQEWLSGPLRFKPRNTYSGTTPIFAWSVNRLVWTPTSYERN